MTQEDRVLTDEQSAEDDDNTEAILRIALDERDKDDDNTYIKDSRIVTQTTIQLKFSEKKL